jgi:AcrR family transcriptional regulator
MGIQERKEREKEVRRQQILVAAKKVITHKGFAKATVEEIAKEAEISPGTIYLYFKNKEELFSALALRALDFLNLRMDDIAGVAAESTLEDNMSETRQAVLDTYRFDSLAIVNMFHLLSAETLNRVSPEFLSRMREQFGRLFDQLTVVFSDQNGGSRRSDPSGTILPDIFLALFSGIFIWSDIRNVIFTGEKSQELSTTLETAVDLLTKGLTTQRASMNH